MAVSPSAGPTGSDPAERTPAGDVTVWLVEWSQGDRRALERLTPLVYAELRRLARGYLSRRRRHHSLQPTALVHEAFVRLIDDRRIDWKNRAHFFGVAAKTMRGILVDHARRRGAAKRGGSAITLSFDEAIAIPGQRQDLELAALDDALTALAGFDPDLARLVELRFFGGLTIEETAVVLGVSSATVKRA
jgi:RNA polymerase sigma-70 factor (ECF subfamily)